MMDESKRKKLIYASVVFIIIIVLAFVGFLIFNKKDNLPPVESDTAETSDSTDTESPADEPIAEESTYKNGIEFKKFNGLSQATVTDSRIDVIRYYLAEYAAKSSGAITAFTLDKPTIKVTEEGERQIYTFTVKDSENTPYKVELSYTYTADAFVRIFDKDNKIIQTSPMDAE